MGQCSSKTSSLYAADGVSLQTPKKRQSAMETSVAGFAKVENRSMEPKGVCESEVHFFEIVGQEVCDSRGIVRASALLRWMDICACLSAEKHGQLSSVTLSMDDLSFDSPITIGTVLEISARVNNAFNTSMEVGVTVSSTATAKPVTFCSAYFTFVSLDHHSKKCAVPKVIPETEAERDNFILAKERRTMRFGRKEKIAKMMEQALSPRSEERVRKSSLVENSEISESLQKLATGGTTKTLAAWTGANKRQSVVRRTFFGPGTDLAPPTTRPMSASSLRMTKVVAPSDTNHMLNTFGGNVMAWMDDAATVAALKHCRYTPLGNHVNVVTIAVDAMQFHGGSKVGDHITCFAQVNRAFGSTMEVGVRVEAQCLGGDVRHINTGYLTIMAIDAATNEPIKLPKVEAEAPRQERQYEQAQARRRLRMERKKLAGQSKVSGLAWTWSADMSQEISVANIYGLLKVANDYALVWHRQDIASLGKKFELKMDINKDTFGQPLMTIRISGLISCDMNTLFKLLMDPERRTEWDMLIAGTEVREEIDDHNSILWMAYPTMGQPGKTTDYSLLRTWRHDEDRYIISSRSVAHPTVPLNEDSKVTRGEVNPSGFVLTPWVMDDGLGRDDYQQQTSFDYLVQLDEKAQQMLGGKELLSSIGKLGGGAKAADSKFVQVMVGSIAKLCQLVDANN